MKGLVYGTELSAVTGLRQIWINIIINAVNTDDCVVKDGVQVKDLTGKSDDYIASCLICGDTNHGDTLSHGLTSCFGIVIEAYEKDNTWFTPVPDAQFLINVVGYIEQEIPWDWFAPTHV